MPAKGKVDDSLTCLRPQKECLLKFIFFFMEVQVNNQLKQLSCETSLQGLLLEMGFEETRGIAVAVNQKVVPKPQWSHYFLQSRDTITIIRATQGG